MELGPFLEAKQKSLRWFSEKSGVTVSTLDRIARKQTRARIDIAGAIVRTSRAHPTSEGESVQWEDLDFEPLESEGNAA